MRNSWPLRALTSVAIAAAGASWAAGPAEAPTAAYPRQQVPDSQDNGIAHRDDKGAGPNTGPSPSDRPNPGLRLDPRIEQLPGERSGNGDGANAGNGNDDGTDNGTDDANPKVPPTHVPPQNPAKPGTPIFPANPHPPAQPGEPGNPVTPTTLQFA